MPCDEMRDRFSPYLEGELGDSERKALEAHLGECADCAALLAVLRESVASLRAAPEAEPPAHLARRIQEAVAQKAAERSRSRTAWGWAWMPAFAAAASFLVMIGLIVYLDRSAETPMMIAAKVEQEAPRPVGAPAPPPVERMRAVETEKAPAPAKEAPEEKAPKESQPKPPLMASRAEEVGKAGEISLADKKEGAERARQAESIPAGPRAARKEIAKITPAAAGAPRPTSLRPEVVITLSDPAVRERALSIVASLGGVPAELREEAKAKKEVGAVGPVSPQEIEKFSFPFGQYDRLIAELRAIDPNVTFAPSSKAASESELRLIIRTRAR